MVSPNPPVVTPNDCDVNGDNSNVVDYGNDDDDNDDVIDYGNDGDDNDDAVDYGNDNDDNSIDDKS